MAHTFYTATLSPLADSGVMGQVRVFSPTAGTVCFVGSATGLEPNLDSMFPEIPARTGTDCSATNGCGVHVHVGTGPDACTNSTTQGGHWWNDATLAVDPWLLIGYLDTSADGAASFADCVYTGFDLEETMLESRTFIVHANDGSRVSCGLMEVVEEAEPTHQTMEIATTALSDSGVAGEVTVMTNVSPDVPDGVCFLGSATGLEPNLDSAYTVGVTTPGTDCTATNGCGVHIHSGTACDDSTTQGGHYYDSATVPIDPWLIVGYTSTDADGAATFADCVLTGEADYESKPVIIHANDGSRVSCGLLVETQEDSTPPPSSGGSSSTSRTPTAAGGFFGGLLAVSAVAAVAQSMVMM